MEKRFNAVELYELLKTKENTYFLTFDIVDMESINEINYDAGNLAIKESQKRIIENTDKNMLLVNIGEDKFVLVTGLPDIKAAQKLAQKVVDLNGNSIYFDGKEIPLYMRIGGTLIENIKDYCELLAKLDATIERPKGKNVECAFLD